MQQQSKQVRQSLGQLISIWTKSIKVGTAETKTVSWLTCARGISRP